jgi:hypothetical protein
VVAPIGAFPVFSGFEHGDMHHEAIGSGAVPVLFARFEEDAVTGADNLNRFAAPLAAADPPP